VCRPAHKTDSYPELIISRRNDRALLREHRVEDSMLRQTSDASALLATLSRCSQRHGSLRSFGVIQSVIDNL
jgi:hypothetical protein